MGGMWILCCVQYALKHTFIFFNLYIPVKFYILKLATTKFSYCFNIVCPYEMLYIYMSKLYKLYCKCWSFVFMRDIESMAYSISKLSLHHLYINSKDNFTLIKCCILCLFWITSLWCVSLWLNTFKFWCFLF